MMTVDIVAARPTLGVTPENLVYAGPFVGKARVHTDYTPPDNEQFMALKVRIAHWYFILSVDWWLFVLFKDN